MMLLQDVTKTYPRAATPALAPTTGLEVSLARDEGLKDLVLRLRQPGAIKVLAVRNEKPLAGWTVQLQG